MTANDVRGIVLSWIHANIPEVSLGLPEFDDRLDQWRIALLAPHNGRDPVGEVRVANGQVVFSTDLDLAKERCRQHLPAELEARTKHPITFRPIPSRIVLGDASEALADYPPGTVQLVFTSPPYFNAKPEYHESAGYGDYLDLLRDIFSKCHDMLSEV